jgi:hypothetical protein
MTLVWKSHYLCENHTRRVEITLERVEITFRRMSWKIERVLAKIYLKSDAHGCEFHAQTCHFHTILQIFSKFSFRFSQNRFYVLDTPLFPSMIWETWDRCFCTLKLKIVNTILQSCLWAYFIAEKILQNVAYSFWTILQIRYSSRRHRCVNYSRNQFFSEQLTTVGAK